jgi:hypothetical protein
VAGHHRYGAGTSYSGAKQEDKQQLSHAGHFGHLPCFTKRHIKLGRRNHLTRYVRRQSFSRDCAAIRPPNDHGPAGLAQVPQ